METPEDKAKEILRSYPSGSRIISEGLLLIAIIPIDNDTVKIIVHDRVTWDVIWTEVVGRVDNLYKPEKNSIS